MVHRGESYFAGDFPTDFHRVYSSLSACYFTRSVHDLSRLRAVCAAAIHRNHIIGGGKAHIPWQLVACCPAGAFPDPAGKKLRQYRRSPEEIK